MSRVVYNGGTYDLIHSGHIAVLRQCRKLAGPGGEVVIALNPDEFVRQFKGHPTVQPYEERKAVLEAIRYVDRVVCNATGADSRPTIDAVAPHIIAVGRDYWSHDDSLYCRQMGFSRDWLAVRGIDLVYLDWVEGHSSTALRARSREVAA